MNPSARIRSRGARRLGAGVLIAGAVFAGSVSPASAATVKSSDAEGRFLGGEVAGIDLDDIAALAPAATASPDGEGPVVESSPLAAEVLTALDLDLGSGISLLGDNGILSLGAVNQYAESGPDGIAKAASGAVSDSGAIEVGGSDEFPANATLDLRGLYGALDADMLQLIANLSLEIGALSASATVDGADGPIARDYQIAGAKLRLSSPALALLRTQLIGSIEDELQPILDGLTGADGVLSEALGNVDALNELLGILGTNLALDGSIDVDVAAFLDPILAGSFGSGGVTLDLASGQIIVDLEELLGGDLNDLEPNTEIINPDVITGILAGITGAADALVADLTGAIGDSLNAAQVNLSANGTVLAVPPLPPLAELDINVSGGLGEIIAGGGTATITAAVGGLPITIPASDLLTALVPPLTEQLMSPGVLGGLVDAVLPVLEPIVGQLGTVFSALPQVISLVGNVQSETKLDNGIEGVQGALTLRLLGDGAVLELARAEVRSIADEVEEPTDPTGPTEPTVPTEPSEPAAPTEPGTPGQPGGPSSPAPGGPGGGLPRTGTNATTPAILGISLLAAGTVIVGIRRRMAL